MTFRRDGKPFSRNAGPSEDQGMLPGTSKAKIAIFDV